MNYLEFRMMMYKVQATFMEGCSEMEKLPGGSFILIPFDPPIEKPINLEGMFSEN